MLSHLFLSSASATAAVSAGLTARSAAPTAKAVDGAGSVVIVTITLLVFAVAVVVLIVALRARSKRAARIAAMSPAERERHEANEAYLARIAAAEKALTRETKARSSRLKACEKALRDAHAIGTRAIAAYRGKDGSARLTELDVTVPQGTYSLAPGVQATVDTAGNLATSSRSTLTRIAAGGLLFGPVGAIVGGTAKKTKMHDTRELYLLITGQEFAALITCNPDDGAKVRQFAVAVMQSALRADELRAHRADAIAQASEPQASQPEASRGAGTDTRPHASETN